MTPDTARGLVFGVLMIHGLGHGGALGALLWLASRPGSDTGGWTAARSWLVPALAGPAGSAFAGTLWIVSLAGFVIAALAFWGILFPTEIWRGTAVVSSAVSLAGIVLFLGTWPVFNTVAAVAVNVAVLVTQLWLRWPEAAVAR